MFLNIYLEWCKEWEHDRFYVQCDSLAIVLELFQVFFGWMIVSYVEMWTPIS
jgi:hypothetical protein